MNSSWASKSLAYQNEYSQRYKDSWQMKKQSKKNYLWNKSPSIFDLLTIVRSSSQTILLSQKVQNEAQSRMNMQNSPSFSVILSKMEQSCIQNSFFSVIFFSIDCSFELNISNIPSGLIINGRWVLKQLLVARIGYQFVILMHFYLSWVGDLKLSLDSYPLIRDIFCFILAISDILFIILILFVSVMVIQDYFYSNLTNIIWLKFIAHLGYCGLALILLVFLIGSFWPNILYGYKM